MSPFPLLYSRLVNGYDFQLNVGRNLLTTWLVLFSVGQGLLLCLLITIIFAKAIRIKERNPIMTNLILTGLLSAISPCLLYYFGEVENPNPPTGLCLTQATIKHGTGIMAIVALLALVIEIFMTTQRTVRSRGPGHYPLRVISLLAAPYLAFVAFAVPVLVMGLRELKNVERVEHLAYCSLKNDIYGTITTAMGILVTLSTVGFEAYTIHLVRKSRKAVQRLHNSKQIDIPLLIRVCIFSGLQIVFIIVTVIDIIPGTNDVVSFTYESLMPTAFFFVFGLRSDLIRTWLFMQTKPDPTISSFVSLNMARGSVERVNPLSAAAGLKSEWV